jgi:hypothetical protein
VGFAAIAIIYCEYYCSHIVMSQEEEESTALVVNPIQAIQEFRQVKQEERLKLQQHVAQLRKAAAEAKRNISKTQQNMKAVIARCEYLEDVIQSRSTRNEEEEQHMEQLRQRTLEEKMQASKRKREAKQRVLEKRKADAREVREKSKATIAESASMRKRRVEERRKRNRAIREERAKAGKSKATLQLERKEASKEYRKQRLEVEVRRTEDEENEVMRLADQELELIKIVKQLQNQEMQTYTQFQGVLEKRAETREKLNGGKPVARGSLAPKKTRRSPPVKKGAPPRVRRKRGSLNPHVPIHGIDKAMTARIRKNSPPRYRVYLNGTGPKPKTGSQTARTHQSSRTQKAAQIYHGRTQSNGSRTSRKAGFRSSKSSSSVAVSEPPPENEEQQQQQHDAHDEPNHVLDSQDLEKVLGSNSNSSNNSNGVGTGTTASEH